MSRQISLVLDGLCLLVILREVSVDIVAYGYGRLNGLGLTFHTSLMGGNGGLGLPFLRSRLQSLHDYYDLILRK